MDAKMLIFKEKVGIDFNTYYKENIIRLKSFLFKYNFKNFNDFCDDVIEDSFINLLNNIESYNTDYNIRTYLYTIARNLCYDYVESMKKYNKNYILTDKILDVVEEIDDNYDYSTDYYNLKQDVYKYCDDITIKIFNMKEEQLEFNEIADILSINESKIKYKFYNIKEKVEKGRMNLTKKKTNLFKKIQKKLKNTQK